MNQEITLEMLEEKYRNTSIDNFAEYDQIVSEYILHKKMPFKITSEEHHDLVALGNDYVFQDESMRQKLMDKVRNVPYEKLYPILQECGMSEQERRMIFAGIYETAFLGCVTGGEASLYMVLRFPVVPLVLHWTKGLFYTTKM